MRKTAIIEQLQEANNYLHDISVLLVALIHLEVNRDVPNRGDLALEQLREAPLKTVQIEVGGLDSG